VPRLPSTACGHREQLSSDLPGLNHPDPGVTIEFHRLTSTDGVTYRLVKGVLVGRIVKVRPHPRGERIWLADVDIGADYQLQIVWGGLPILEEGSFVPVAPPGSRLPGGKMRRRRYRGEISEGMLCSLAELGWDLSVADRVALLDDSILHPGESLVNRDADWKSIVIVTDKTLTMDVSVSNSQVSPYQAITA
jgi:tRNA-binding EMAP/Myf-like protein